MPFLFLSAGDPKSIERTTLDIAIDSLEYHSLGLPRFRLEFNARHTINIEEPKGLTNDLSKA